MKEGWDPLCKFLGVEHPQTDFPKGNQSAVFVKRFEKALLVTLSTIFFRLSMLGGGVVLACYAISRFLRK